MRHPNGPNCGNIKNNPGNCKYCGDRIFWHKCDCGVKVPFDHGVEPLEKHLCEEYLSAAPRKQPIRISRALRTKTKARKRLPYYSLQKTSIRGYIRRIRLDDDALKKLHKDCSSHGIQRIRERIEPPLARVSLLQSPKSGNNLYIFYVCLFDLFAQSIEEGDTVAADLIGINRETWICESLFK